MLRRRQDLTPTGAFGLFIVLWLSTLFFYVVLWLADAWPFTDDRLPALLFPGSATAEVLDGLAEVTVAVLSIAITVVAILVELAATRYSPRITEVFLSDRTHFGVLSFFVMTTVYVVWVTFTLSGGDFDDRPSALVLGAQVSISTSLLLLLPYFAYVFEFISPSRVVVHIADTAVAGLDGLAHGTLEVRPARERVSTAIEQLGDVALKAIQHKDKPIAIAAVTHLGELLGYHLHLKRQLPDAWFEAGSLAYEDSDFVAFHNDTVAEMGPLRTWFDMKGMLQLQAGFHEALIGSRSIAHLIAIRTRKLAVRAAELDDHAGLVVMVRFLNSYTRAAIEASDARTVYNLLNEYRTLCMGLLGTPQQPLVLEVAQRMKVYGQAAFRAQLADTMETAAYDLASLVQHADEQGIAEHDHLLEILLDVDREPDEGGRIQETALQGVRKAQVKLATWYLLNGDVPRARQIFDDMRDERPERLARIRRDLEWTTDPHYWEITDRGRSFDFLEPQRRAQLIPFFGWFQADREPEE